LSLLDRTKIISKESPSSLLGPEPSEAARPIEDVPLKSDGPSGLLPPAERSRYPSEQKEELAAVSPTSLLPPPAEPAYRRKLVRWGVIGATVVVLAIVLMIFSSREKPIPELMQEAVASLNAGRFEEASIHLKNVLKREPSHLEASTLLGKAYLRMGAYLDAEKVLRQARESGSSGEDVSAMLVESLLALDRPRDALKELNAAANLSGLGARSALLLGRANLGIGNFVDAKTQFTIVRNTDPVAGEAGLARVLMLEGEVDTARQMTVELIAKHPGEVDAWMVRADFLRGMGEEKEALDAYRKVQALKSDHLEAAIGASVILIEQGEFADAQREIKKARAIAPSSHQLGFVNALLAFRERRYGDCREYLHGILEAAPNHMPSVMLAGALSLQVADFEQAQNAFMAYLTRFPGHLPVRKLLAITFLNKKQPQAAVDTLARFVHLDIRDAEFFAVAGQAFLQVNDVKRALATLARAASLDPKNADVLTDIGLAKMAAGAEREGLAELEKAVALAPKTARADRHLALAYLARNRLDEVLKVATGIEQRLPNTPEPHWLRGLVSAVRKQPAEARASYERALKTAPGYLPAAVSLAELDAQEGRSQETRARFESVLRANPGSVETVLALAQLDVTEGKFAEGIRRLRRAAEQHPSNAQLQVLLASLLMRDEKFEDAVHAARQARELNPRDPRSAELLGQLQMRSGDAASAVLSFTTLVGISPRYVPGWMQLVQAQRVSGDRRAAIASAREAERYARSDPNLLGLLGDVLLEDKRFDEALKVARFGQEKHPEMSYGFALEGHIRLLQGNAAQAVSLFREAERREPTGMLRIRLHQAESARLGRDAPIDLLLDWIEKQPQDTSVQRYTADVMVRLGRIDEAMQLYERVLKAAPNDFRLLNNIADALMRKDDPRALDYAQQAFQAQATDATVLTTLGAVLLRRGRLAEAVQTLQKAIDLDPGQTEARLLFARALIAAGDRTRAKLELQRLVGLNKEFPELAEARRLLGQL